MLFQGYGRVVSGRGLAAGQLFSLDQEVRNIVGQSLFPGTLNLILESPIRLREEAGSAFDGKKRIIWPALLNDVDVWVYRWPTTPLHVVEILAAQSLRKHLCLKDGDSVSLRLDGAQVTNVSMLNRLAWAAIWKWREPWPYSRDEYYSRTMRFCLKFGATQQQPLLEKPLDIWLWAMKKILKKKFPRAASVAKKIRSSVMGTPAINRHEFVRLDTNILDQRDRHFRQIRNILEYTKLSGSAYSATSFPAAYHTIEIDGRKVQGQRDPARRFDFIPFDFTGKTVLDLGCNQGGMILHLRDKLKWAVGVDYDSRMVNAANRVKAETNAGHINFYVFNLESEPLDLISDFLPDEKVDVCFLLSVCMWLANWQAVFDFACAKSKAMLFETNGSDEQQNAQIAHIRSRYRNVKTLAETSEDDPGQKQRKLFYLTEPFFDKANWA